MSSASSRPRRRALIPFAGFHGRHKEAALRSLLMTAGFKPTGPPGCQSVELQFLILPPPLEEEPSLVEPWTPPDADPEAGLRPPSDEPPDALEPPDS